LNCTCFIAELNKLGLDKNTVVIFAGDSGELLKNLKKRTIE
jgi:hypothetical protein